MNYELDFFADGQKRKAFLQDGFFDTAENVTTIIHSHMYAEMHVILSGSTEFRIGNGIYSFTRGDVFLIPAGVYHCCIGNGTAFSHFAVQMDADISRLKTGKLSDAVLDEVLRTAEAVKRNGTRNRISAVLSLVLAYITEDGDVPLSRMTDTAAVIHEFISRHYNRNVRLAELAALLSFSEKQAERLVVKHTGTTFRRAVIKTRLTVADYLQRHTDLTNAAIAEYVGYATYSGFLKAKHMYEKTRLISDTPCANHKKTT